MSKTCRRIGLLVPAADPRSEKDFHQYLSSELTVHTTRLYESESSWASSLENLDELVSSIPGAARLVALVEPELIVFCCTSASLYKGYGWDRKVAGMITEATGIPATTTSTAVVEAHRALGLSKVFMITPYPEHTNRLEAEFLEASGIAVTGFTSLDCAHSKDLGRVTPERIAELVRAKRAAIEAAGGLFVSCTALPVFEMIEGLEVKLGVPVVSSNQATLWHTLRILAVRTGGIPGGRLYQPTQEKATARIA